MTAQPTRDQLRALANAATEGPWEIDLDGDIQGRRKGCSPDPEMDPMVGTLDRPEDTAFIAAARTAVPHLLDQLDQQEATMRRQDRYIEELESVNAVGLTARAETAEARVRDLTQEVRDERGAALDQMEQVRIRDARLQAVRDVLDRKDADLDAMSNPPHRHRAVLMSDIRRALDGDT